MTLTETNGKISHSKCLSYTGMFFHIFSQTKDCIRSKSKYLENISKTRLKKYEVHIGLNKNILPAVNDINNFLCYCPVLVYGKKKKKPGALTPNPIFATTWHPKLHHLFRKILYYCLTSYIKVRTTKNQLRKVRSFFQHNIRSNPSSKAPKMNVILISTRKLDFQFTHINYFLSYNWWNSMKMILQINFLYAYLSYRILDCDYFSNHDLIINVPIKKLFLNKKVIVLRGHTFA